MNALDIGSICIYSLHMTVLNGQSILMLMADTKWHRWSKSALDPACILQRCHYVLDGESAVPEWKDSPTGESYKRSCNIGPSIFTPVLLSAKHWDSCDNSKKRLLQPMRWGLIPSWHKGSRTDFKTMHNNCRGETVMEKNTFSVPFKKGRRCVVVAEGFYEWKTSGNTKTPFMFVPKGFKTALKDLKANENLISDTPASVGNIPADSQSTKVKDECIVVKPEPRDRLSITVHTDTEPVCEAGLLYMAGIFDVFKEAGGDLYSYTILTVESRGAVADVHHRMPVILTSQEDIDIWLDYETFSYTQALKLVTARDCLDSYEVASKVNNIRYQGSDCCVPVCHDKSNVKKSDIRNWFKSASADSKPAKRKSDLLLMEDEKMPIKSSKTENYFN